MDILEGLLWCLSRLTSAAIAQHAMALFLNAVMMSRSALSRSEASNLLQLIGRRIKARVSDYVVSISASPSRIMFGGCGIRSRNGKAGDHHCCRVGIDNGRALRRQRVDAGVGGRGAKSEDDVRRDCHRGRKSHAVAGGGCRASFLGG